MCVWQADHCSGTVDRAICFSGIVWAGAFEFIACENDLQAAPDALWNDKHSLQTSGSTSIQERFMDNKRNPP